MADALQQLRDFYSGLEPARRRALLAASVASVLAVGGVGIWAAQPSEVVLTHAASTEERDQVTRALGQGGVPFEIDADGLTIRVPSASATDARKLVASTGPVGFEFLTEIPAYITPGQERLYNQFMLQGELVRMINGGKGAGIASSDVQISLPERTAFLRDNARATASVTLHPAPGVTLDAAAARGVAMLVARAVPGMVPNGVTVVDDSTMRVLWGGDTGDGSTGEAEADLARLAVAREASLATAIRTNLIQILGDPQAATVAVRVELETAQTTTTTHTIDPDSAVPTSEKTESETDTRAGTSSRAAGGVPGTDSNLPEAATAGSVNGGGSRKKESSLTTYETNSTDTTVVQPAGDIRRVSATVNVDAAAFAKLVAGGDEAQVRKDLEASIRAALGATEARKDTVVLSVLPFIRPEPVETVPEPLLASTDWQAMLPSAVAALAVLLAFVFFVRPLVKAIAPAKVATAPDAAGAAARAQDEDDLEAPIDLAARLRARVAALQSRSPADVSQLVTAESERSAEVLRRWIRT